MPEGGYEIDSSETLLISPKIIYDYDTRYEWYKNGILIQTEKDLEYKPESIASEELFFKVMCDRGNDSMTFIVKTLNFIRFEELELDENSFWNGTDGSQKFHSRNITFPNVYYPETKLWGGFIYSNRTIKSKDSLNIEYSAYAGKGADDSNNYIVMHYDEQQHGLNRLSFANNELHTIKSIQVINTASNYYIIKNGNSTTDPLPLKGTFELIMIGYDENGTATDSIKYFLANNSITPNFTNQSWTKKDLESLGKINQLEFQFVTMPDTITPIPGYVCIDNIIVED